MPPIAPTSRTSARIALSSRLAKDVAPDAGAPRNRVLRHRRGRTRRQLLLDLDDLAVVDPVRVDDRDRLAVARPAVAGVAGGEDRGLLAVQQVDHRRRADLAHRI